MKACLEERPGNWGVTEVIGEKNAIPQSAEVVLWKRTDGLLCFWAVSLVYIGPVSDLKRSILIFRPYQAIKSLAFWMPHDKIREESEKGIITQQYFPQGTNRISEKELPEGPDQCSSAGGLGSWVRIHIL